jgi:hypothetical protein
MDYVSIYDLHGLILIKDSVTADCSGVVSSILKLALSEGTSSPRSVLVVTSKHSTSYYSMVLRRLNLNVSRIAATGRFRVLNTNTLAVLNAGEDTVEYRIGNLLDALLQTVNELKSTSDQRQCLVIFDDYTVRCMYTNLLTLICLDHSCLLFAESCLIL